MNSSLSRLERMYFHSEADYGIIPAQADANDAVHNVRFTMNNDTPLIERPDKTGSRGMVAGVPGRRSCRWDAEFGLTGGSRMHPLLLSTMGAGSPGSYTLDDAIKSFVAWSYRRPSTIAQRVGHGLIVSEATWNLGQDQAATCSMRGEGQWVLHSDLIGSADDVQKGGITAFNPEPAAVYSDTGLIIGFTGEALFGTDVIAFIRTAQIRIATGNRCVRDTFGSFYATGTEGGVRQITCGFSCYDDDDASMTNLRAHAESKDPLNIRLKVGLADNQYIFHMNNVQLGSETLGDQQLRWTSDWSEGVAKETTAGAGDEFTITHTT